MKKEKLVWGKKRKEWIALAGCISILLILLYIYLSTVPNVDDLEIQKEIKQIRFCNNLCSINEDTSFYKVKYDSRIDEWICLCSKTTYFFPSQNTTMRLIQLIEYGHIISLDNISNNNLDLK